MLSKRPRRSLAAGVGLLIASCGIGVQAQTAAIGNPVAFVTQYPMRADFATIGSTFANHLPDHGSAGRGGDLYVRFPDGSLCNLTATAGFGEAESLQGERAIAVRDPAVSVDGQALLFSMVIGAGRWQLYEARGFAGCDAATLRIERIAGQDERYNNIMPVALSEQEIVFVSDSSPNGEPHLKALDEYESTPTNSGLWKLRRNDGALTQIQRSPSGSFHPMYDSFGRVLFTRWDHLQRDQQNETPDNSEGIFNYASELDLPPTLGDRSEYFPERRDASATTPVGVENRHTFNHFFPWEIAPDGTCEETLNHLGRHELIGFFERSFTSPDMRLVDHGINAPAGGMLLRADSGLFQLAEEPGPAGCYLANYAREFGSHGAGQVVRFCAAPGVNPEDIRIVPLTAEGSFNFGAGGAGQFRSPLPMADGKLLAVSTDAEGTLPSAAPGAPDLQYQFRIRQLVPGANGLYERGPFLLEQPIVRRLTLRAGDRTFEYDGPMWELDPVEIVARTVPTPHRCPMPAQEEDIFAQAGVAVDQLQDFLRRHHLALAAVRDVTSRDDIDRQQPFNLRAPDDSFGPGVERRVGDAGMHTVGSVEFFQGDLVRGIGLTSPTDTVPRAGRRVLAMPLHDDAATRLNREFAEHAQRGSASASALPVFSDGSMVAIVPAARPLSWQLLDAGTRAPLVRERYWVTLQPGEIRVCDGCHGVNRVNQAGSGPAQNSSLALRELLRWFAQHGPIFHDGMESR